jgi:hypothetical protein
MHFPSQVLEFFYIRQAVNSTITVLRISSEMLWQHYQGEVIAKRGYVSRVGGNDNQGKAGTP